MSFTPFIFYALSDKRTKVTVKIKPDGCYTYHLTDHLIAVIILTLQKYRSGFFFFFFVITMLNILIVGVDNENYNFE